MNTECEIGVLENGADAPVIIKTKLDGPPFDADTWVIFDEHSWNNHHDECYDFSRLINNNPSHLAKLWQLMEFHGDADKWVTLSDYSCRMTKTTRAGRSIAASSTLHTESPAVRAQGMVPLSL